MFESNARTHCTTKNDGLATQPVYLYPNGGIVISTTPLEILYSINLILGFCYYIYTRSLAPFSFDLLIRVNCHCAVRTPV